MRTLVSDDSFPNLLFISHELLLYVVLIFLIKKKKKRKPRSRSPVVITKRQSRNADRAHGSRIVGRRQHLWQRPSLRAETWRSGFEIIPVQMSPLSCKQFVRAGQVRNSLKSRSEQISPCKASCEKQGWKDMKALALGPYCLLPSSPPTPECKGAGEKEGRKDTEWGGEKEGERMFWSRYVPVFSWFKTRTDICCVWSLVCPWATNIPVMGPHPLCSFCLHH